MTSSSNLLIPMVIMNECFLAQSYDRGVLGGPSACARVSATDANQKISEYDIIPGVQGAELPEVLAILSNLWVNSWNFIQFSCQTGFIK